MKGCCLFCHWSSH